MVHHDFQYTSQKFSFNLAICFVKYLYSGLIRKTTTWGWNIHVWYFLLEAVLVINEDTIAYLLYNASLLVRAAIKLLMKTFPFMLSNAGTWGLVVRGVLIIEDAAGEAGIGVDGWFAVLEVSPNRTRVERFFGCCDDMVILLARFDRVIGPFYFYCQGLVVSWEIAKEKAKRNELGQGWVCPRRHQSPGEFVY